MRPGWIIGLLMAFLLLHLVNGVCEMTFVTGDTETIIQPLLEVDVGESVGWWEIITTTISYAIAAIRVLWSAMWFDYSFLTGGWIFLRFIYLAISAGIAFGIFLAMRGTSSS